MKKSISWILTLVMAMTVFAIPTSALAETETDTPSNSASVRGLTMVSSQDFDTIEMAPVAPEGITYDFNGTQDEYGEPDQYFDLGVIRESSATASPAGGTMVIDGKFYASADWSVENPEVAEFVKEPEEGTELVSKLYSKTLVKIKCLKEGTTKVHATIHCWNVEEDEFDISLNFILTVEDSANYTIYKGLYDPDEDIYNLARNRGPSAITPEFIATDESFLGYTSLYLLKKDLGANIAIDYDPDQDDPAAVELSGKILDNLVDNESVKWTTSDEEVAYIEQPAADDDFRVPVAYFLGEGPVTLTATSLSGKTTEIHFRVTNADWDIVNPEGFEYSVAQTGATADTATIIADVTDPTVNPMSDVITIGFQLQKQVGSKYQAVDNEILVDYDDNGALTGTATLTGLTAGHRSAYRIRDVWTFTVNKGQANEKTVTRRSQWHNFKVTAKPDKVEGLKLTTKSKSITAKWKRTAGQGYKIEIARNSSFTKGKKTKYTYSYRDNMKKITGLKKGTKYYVRVSAFNFPDGDAWSANDFYGSASSKKSIKCK